MGKCGKSQVSVRAHTKVCCSDEAFSTNALSCLPFSVIMPFPPPDLSGLTHLSSISYTSALTYSLPSRTRIVNLITSLSTPSPDSKDYHPQFMEPQPDFITRYVFPSPGSFLNGADPFVIPLVHAFISAYHASISQHFPVQTEEMQHLLSFHPVTVNPCEVTIFFQFCILYEVPIACSSLH